MTLQDEQYLLLRQLQWKQINTRQYKKARNNYNKKHAAQKVESNGKIKTRRLQIHKADNCKSKYVE